MAADAFTGGHRHLGGVTVGEARLKEDHDEYGRSCRRSVFGVVGAEDLAEGDGQTR